MTWSQKEFDLVRRLRAADPPVHYAVIGERLGRTGEAVRQKLISERVAHEAGGTRTRMGWRKLRVARPWLGDRAFRKRLMAGGGHSRFTEAVRNDGLRTAYPVLIPPLIGPDGLARPCGRGDCQCLRAQKHPCPKGHDLNASQPPLKEPSQ